MDKGHGHGRHRVLGVFAHPDDETFGPGGTLARLAAEGHSVHLFSATRGESGTIDRSAALGRRQLAAVRVEELKQACRVLGIAPPHIFPFPDFGLARLEEETLLRPIVRIIRILRPTILITFHADGLSGHLDHRTITARVHTAFSLAAETGLWPELGPPHAAARLWLYSIPESRARQITYRRIHAVPDKDLDALVDVRRYLSAKRAAVAAHASQARFVHDLEDHVGGLDEFWRDEGFVLGAARFPLPSDVVRPVDDLFLGIPFEEPESIG